MQNRCFITEISLSSFALESTYRHRSGTLEGDGPQLWMDQLPHLGTGALGEISLVRGFWSSTSPGPC